MTRKKLIEYIPAMLITNLSTLLLISVDGLVVGNLVGSKALSAVNIFSPATLLIGVISAMIASGIGVCLSTGIGANDPQKLLRTKSAMKKMMAIIYHGVFNMLVQSESLKYLGFVLSFASYILVAKEPIMRYKNRKNREKCNFGIVI